MTITLRYNLNDNLQQQVIDLFNDRLKGKSPPPFSKGHNGAEGHWVETQLGIKHNKKNKPDIFGFECKKDSKHKITFGDWSADLYPWSPNWEIQTEVLCPVMSREIFIKTFGTLKGNRYSWSGTCFPKYEQWNSCGQTIVINDDNSICIYYHNIYDNRSNKLQINGKILIAKWTTLKSKVENKFGQKGFFICKKKQEIYDYIVFGYPLDYKLFLAGIREGNIILDSGMKEMNARNYSAWRASCNFWNKLLR